MYLICSYPLGTGEGSSPLHQSSPSHLQHDYPRFPVLVLAFRRAIIRVDPTIAVLCSYQLLSCRFPNYVVASHILYSIYSHSSFYLTHICSEEFLTHIHSFHPLPRLLPLRNPFRNPWENLGTPSELLQHLPLPTIPIPTPILEPLL